MADDESRGGTEREIRARIERTRARMGATIEEIGAHLNPEHLKQEFKAGVREQVEHTKREIRGATIGRAEAFLHEVEETVNHTRRTLIETIRDNPVAAAMAGIGLGWLLTDARRHPAYDDGRRYTHRGEWERTRGGIATTAPGYVSTTGYTAPPMTRAEQLRAEAAGMRRAVGNEAEHLADRARDGASEVAEQASYVADQARDAVVDAADRVQSTASHLAGRAQHAAEETWEEAEYRARQAQRLAQANPLAAGAVSLALGFAAGMLIPETPQENRLMGPARDRLVDRAEDMARHTVDAVERVAERTAERAETAVRQEASGRGPTSPPERSARTL